MKRLNLFLALFILPFADSALAQTARYDVFFVSVGSQHYAARQSGAVRSFKSIHGVNRSAKRIANLLLRGGASFGVLVTSEQHSFVGLVDVDNALDRVIGAAKTSGAERPFLIFYFAGHGISEGIAWNLFGIPGNLQLASDELNSFCLEDLGDQALHVATIVERLTQSSFPYLIMIDTCYEGSAANFRSPVLSAEASRNLADLAAVLRFMNEFHQPEPVLFSTEPGTLVPTVSDPRNASGQLTVAPLARRATLLADKANRHGEAVSLAAFLDHFSSGSSDNETEPAVTRAEHDPTLWAGFILDHKTKHRGRLEEYKGTAQEVVLCCSEE